MDFSQNTEDSTRLQFDTRLEALKITLKPLVETPYSHTVCELALAGVGVGIAHPIVALDFVKRGLVVKPIDIEAIFTGVLVFRPGTPLAENAKQFSRHMRLQLGRDQKVLVQVMGAEGATVRERSRTKRPRRQG